MSLFDEPAPPQSFYRVRMRSGASHVYADPPLPGTKETDPVRQDHPELLRWMGEQGWSEVGEIPPRRDNSGDPCRKCGERGVENHHWAPREVFGDECEDWPQDDLCRKCHREWHDRMNAWAGKKRPPGWEGIEIPT